MGTRKRAAAAAAGPRSAAARLVHDCTLPHWTDISGFTTAELRAGQVSSPASTAPNIATEVTVGACGVQALLLTGQAVLEVLQGAVDVDGFLVTAGDAPLPLSTAGQVGLAITLTAQAHATQVPWAGREVVQLSLTAPLLHTHPARLTRTPLSSGPLPPRPTPPSFTLHLPDPLPPGGQPPGTAAAHDPLPEPPLVGSAPPGLLIPPDWAAAVQQVVAAAEAAPASSDDQGGLGTAAAGQTAASGQVTGHAACSPSGQHVRRQGRQPAGGRPAEAGGEGQAGGGSSRGAAEAQTESRAEGCPCGPSPSPAPAPRPVSVAVVGPRGGGKSSLSRLLVNGLLASRQAAAPQVPSPGPTPEPQPCSRPPVAQPLAVGRRKKKHRKGQGAQPDAASPHTCCNGEVGTAAAGGGQQQGQQQQQGGGEGGGCKAAWPPLVVNLHGWVTGLGLELCCEVLRDLNPTFVLQVNSPVVRRNTQPGPFWWPGPPTSCLTTCLPVCSPATMRSQQRQQQQRQQQQQQQQQEQQQQQQCHLPFTAQAGRAVEPSAVTPGRQQHSAGHSGAAPGGTYEGLDLYDTAADLAACAPFVIDLDDVAVHFLHTRPPPQAHLGFALNGAVVGLAQRCPTACDQECGAAHPPACVGVGLIRAFDGARRQIYLLTPTPEEVLHSVTCLLVGKAAAFELPPSLLQAGPLDSASPYLGLWSLPGVTGATAGAANQRARKNLGRVGLVHTIAGGGGSYLVLRHLKDSHTVAAKSPAHVLAEQLGICPDIAGKQARLWRCAALSDTVFKETALCSVAHTQVPGTAQHSKVRQADTYLLPSGQFQGQLPRGATALDLVALERLHRQTLELGIVPAVMSTLLSLEEWSKLPLHSGQCQGTQLTQELTFQTSWVVYLWGRAAAAGFYSPLAEQRAEYWGQRLLALSHTSGSGPLMDQAASAARLLCELQAAQLELSRLGVEHQLWQHQRRQVIKAALRGLVEAARPDLSPAQVDAVVAEVNKRMTMGSKQCVLAAVPCLPVLLQSFLGQPTPGFPAAGPAPGPPPPPDPACPPYAHPRLATRSSPRTAAAPAQLPSPVQLNIWDPQLLAQIRDAMELLTKASVLEHLMHGPHHRGIRLLPGEVDVFEQPSSAWPVAMLKELNEVHLLGDLNTLNANATKIITSIQEFYRHPGRFIGWWCKAVGVVEGGFSRAMKKHFPQLVLGRLDYS
ncbi:hypothetical protein QJQ45_001598 [Haematococcus lacustris]|nr:hypothetical protein QJQ45_001598 [Haematococcus lacustris]